MKNKLLHAFTFALAFSLALWIIFMFLGILCSIWQGTNIMQKFLATDFSIVTMMVFSFSFLGILLTAYISYLTGKVWDIQRFLKPSQTEDIGFLRPDEAKAQKDSVIFIALNSLTIVLVFCIYGMPDLTVLPDFIMLTLGYLLVGVILVLLYIGMLTCLSKRHIEKLVGKKILVPTNAGCLAENSELKSELEMAHHEIDILKEKLAEQKTANEYKGSAIASCHFLPNKDYLGIECCANGTAYFGKWLAIIALQDGTVLGRVVNENCLDDFNALKACQEEDATNEIKDSRRAKIVVTKFRRHGNYPSRREAAMAFLDECKKRPSFHLGKEARNYLTQLTETEKTRKEEKNENKQG